MIVVWSKDNCPYCTAAFELLNRYNLSYEIRKLGEGWTKEELLESAPAAKTVPQILIDGKLIGGHADLVNYIEDTGFNGTGWSL